MSKPCISCGQTKGKIYKGQPHDHVCADCGRAMPVPDELPTYSLSNPQFLFVDIDNMYTIKYDGYREKNHWTLLRKGGGHILNGDFYDVVAYFIRFQKEEILDDYVTTTNNDKYIQKTNSTTGTDCSWVCQSCLAHIPAGVFHVCPIWENFESEPE